MTSIRNYVQEKNQQSTNLLPHFELAIISLMWPIPLKGSYYPSTKTLRIQLEQALNWNNILKSILIWHM